MLELKPPSFCFSEVLKDLRFQYLVNQDYRPTK